MKRIIKKLAVCCLNACVLVSLSVNPIKVELIRPESDIVCVMKDNTPKSKKYESNSITKMETFSISQSEIEYASLTESEIELISIITIAEAEGECEEGKRLVIDAILNRVVSDYFPNTVEDVIYQKNQFSSVWDGRAEKCEATDHIRKLVREESITVTNTNVIYFTAFKYGSYGTPLFQVGNHCFSGY